jgi:hypothetical protein
MSNLKSILSSFHLKDELNPKIWESSDKMSSKVRDRLLDIAYEFIEFLGVDVVISDVVMMGSLANYNWSRFSDVDLHLIADFEQFSEKELPLYEELFKLKKTLFNDKHNIKIYGYDVELYVQDDVKAFSSGEYSVLFDEWKKKPKKENVKIDTDLIKNKSEHWMKIIDEVISDAKEQPLESGLETINKIKDKLKKYRTAGLEDGGEMSDENLVFKVLRRNGYIKKLFDFQNEYQDTKLSLKEKQYNK